MRSEMFCDVMYRSIQMKCAVVWFVRSLLQCWALYIQQVQLNEPQWDQVSLFMTFQTEFHLNCSFKLAIYPPMA